MGENFLIVKSAPSKALNSFPSISSFINKILSSKFLSNKIVSIFFVKIFDLYFNLKFSCDNELSQSFSLSANSISKSFTFDKAQLIR